MNARQRSSTLAAAIAVIAIAGAVVASRSSAFHTLAWMSPDSASYLKGDVGRTPAYPLLLHVIPLDRLAFAQLVALCASTAWLAWELAGLLPALLAIAFEMLVLGNTQLMAYAFTVLPEAFFVSVCQIQFALAIRLIRSRGHADGIALGLTTALLILLKPSGYSFVAPLVVMLWWRWRGAPLPVVPAVVAMAGAILVVSAINFARAGVFGTQAHGGYALVGYVGHLIDAETPTRYPGLARTVATRTATSRAELMATKGLDAYYIVSSSAYHDVLDTISEAIAEDIRRSSPAIDQRAAAVQLNTIGQSLAVSAIAAHPAGYFRQVAAHLYGLWFLPLLRNRAHADAFAAELDRATQAAPFTLRSPVAFRTLPPLLFWPIKIMLAGALAAACAGVLLAISARTPLAMWLAYCGIALHANFLLVAAVQTGLPRYALAMWPATIATVVTGIWCGIEAVRVRRGVPGRETMSRAGPSV